MFKTKMSLIGALIAALALFVAAAVPTFAATGAIASEATPAPPSVSVTPLAEESCASGTICVWPQAGYQGTRGSTACSAVGHHPLGGTKHSVKNRCGSQGVGLLRAGEAVTCIGAGGNGENVQFDELNVASGNC